MDFFDFSGIVPALPGLWNGMIMTVRVRSPAGDVWFESSQSLPDELPTDPGLGSLQIKGTAYRVLNPIPDTTGEPRLTLLLDITHHQHFLQRMQHLIWLTVGLSALATALLGAWAARSGLRPLRRMSAIAASVSADSLNARLPQQNMPAELAELAAAFNAMLERLDDSFQRLSAFSADIAHELRTPLSNLLTHTQVTLTRPRDIDEYREALHSNLEELQWMAQLVNDMLYLAKAFMAVPPELENGKRGSGARTRRPGQRCRADRGALQIVRADRCRDGGPDCRQRGGPDDL